MIYNEIKDQIETINVIAKLLGYHSKILDLGEYETLWIQHPKLTAIVCIGKENGYTQMTVIDNDNEKAEGGIFDYYQDNEIIKNNLMYITRVL